MNPLVVITITLVTLLSFSNAQNYCGATYAEATSCENACPSGNNADCPRGQTCFASVDCGANDPQTAECGGGTECPLKACCSKWGYCGWTEDFCNDDCQSNCEFDVKSPECDLAPAAVTFGYYASWAARRDCHSIPPERLRRAASKYTHLAFSFAFVSDDSRVVPADSRDVPMYREFNALKDDNLGLKTVIAVGGWAFNDPPTHRRFSRMAATPSSRAKFINSVIEFCEQYGFDGVDLDWEYPVAEDRGGVEADKDKYVRLVREMRQRFDALGKPLSITMAVPLSNWYLRHFDIEQLNKYLDFFNLMSYDLHGVWDGDIPSLGPYVKSHTNMTEIKQGLKMFYKNGVAASRLVLGIGAYGRTWTLEDRGCSKPGCRFKGAGRAGECTGAEGFKGYFEIRGDVATGKYDKNEYDEESESMYFVDGDQWISYDNVDTFQKKRDFAKEECMLGTMLWSVDMIDGDPFGEKLDPEQLSSEPEEGTLNCMEAGMDVWVKDFGELDVEENPLDVTCAVLRGATASPLTALISTLLPCTGAAFSVYQAYTAEAGAFVAGTATAGVVTSSGGNVGCFRDVCGGIGLNFGVSVGYVVGILFSDNIEEMSGFSLGGGSDLVIGRGGGYTLSRGDSGVFSLELSVSVGVGVNVGSATGCWGGLFSD